MKELLSVKLHALESKWRVDKESPRQNMKRIRKLLILDVEIMHLEKLNFPIPYAAIYACKLCKKFRNILQVHDF